VGLHARQLGPEFALLLRGGELLIQFGNVLAYLIAHRQPTSMLVAVERPATNMMSHGPHFLLRGGEVAL
jgi:hypothetical protein